MKTTKLLATIPLAIATTMMLSSCGDGGGGPAAASGPAHEVTIQANDQMKFDVTSIEVKPGQAVQVTLKNIGTMPKVSMGHNFVVLDGKVAPEEFIEASQMQMANDYVAPELESHVIAHTKLLGPGEFDTITFTAPTVAGDYPFLCSFPGHYAIGMKGILSVK